jgi:GDP-L-fucose synthase
MNLNDKIYIAGHRGLVGSAIVRQLEAGGFSSLLMRTHNELDLTNQAQVQRFFKQERPDYVILAAAKVGGIHANNTYPADFIYQNIMIEANVINSAYENKVKRLLFLGSTCIYPKSIKQPMREDALLTDVLEPTNEPYALAKISGIKLCESYNRQYGTDFRSVMPTNLYGEGDNFNLNNSHVIPAIMRRFHLAKCLEEGNWIEIKQNLSKSPIKGISGSSSKDQILEIFAKNGIKIINRNRPSIKQNNQPLIVQNLELNIVVEIWGSGSPSRDFLHVNDMAEASLFVLELDKNIYQANTEQMLSHVNVGTGKGVTISEMVKIMKEIVGYKGGVTFDLEKPDGSPKKLIDVTRLKNMNWEYQTGLKEGLIKTYEWYTNN